MNYIAKFSGFEIVLIVESPIDSDIDLEAALQLRQEHADNGGEGFEEIVGLTEIGFNPFHNFEIEFPYSKCDTLDKAGDIGNNHNYALMLLFHWSLVVFRGQFMCSDVDGKRYAKMVFSQAPVGM